ncbi:hypothetical protein ACJMK2_013528 [Sinanodonta woodiana]|uniref:Uncharacterized protein n=1 Tax=Sinanodonta woodiana TaxID=1069815 RepID=A0ABD3UXT9_SINWO
MSALDNVHQSYGEQFFRTYFSRVECEDTPEGSVLHAYRYEWAQAIDLSHVVAGDRPNAPTLLTQIIARGIPVSEIEPFTHIGRGGGVFLIYPRTKKFLLPMGSSKLEIVADVKASLPVTQKVGAKSIYIYVTGFPGEIPIKAFRKS